MTQGFKLRIGMWRGVGKGFRPNIHKISRIRASPPVLAPFLQESRLPAAAPKVGIGVVGADRVGGAVAAGGGARSSVAEGGRSVLSPLCCKGQVDLDRARSTAHAQARRRGLHRSALPICAATQRMTG